LSPIASADNSCQTAKAPLDDLTAAANNSYFLKWRPTFHFQAPNSWMNGSSLLKER
jgi:sucrose-6-phosphate hydrolase SacC (GH32 family)